MMNDDYEIFCAHFKSSSRGLQPVKNSMIDSNDDQNLQNKNQ